jgi:hypothetical protein
MQKLTSRKGYKQTEIVEIPENWESIPLGQTGRLANIISYNYLIILFITGLA